MKPLVFSVLGVLGVLGSSAHAGLEDMKKATRERGVIYLADMNLAPIAMRLEKKVPVYYQADLKRFLGEMVAPAKIMFEGLSGNAFYIRGRAAYGQDVTGWVSKEDMPLDQNLLEQLRAVYERAKVVNELIDQKQVAVGMTAQEVKKSLGEPTQSSSYVDGEGRVESLEYAVYERVPQVQTARDVYGQIYQQTIYLKVETGIMTVTLQNDAVTSVSEAKGNPVIGRGVKIVPPPVVFEEL